MKILYVNSLYAPHIGGGAEISIGLIASKMQARGHEVIVLATGPTRNLVEEEIDGIRVYRAPLKNYYWHYKASKKSFLLKKAWHIKDRYNAAMRDVLRAIIEKEKPDLVSCHNLTGWSISIWDEIASAGIPIVQVLHDLYLLCARSTMFANGRSCQRRCSTCSLLRMNHARASEAVSAVVGVSARTLQEFVRHGYFRTSARRVIHNARDISPAKNREKHDVQAPVRFGYIGTLAPWKGVEWLIQQFEKRDLNATLLIAGSGENEYEEYLKKSLRNNRISFAGHMNAAEFFSSIDVCVVPSIWQEPLGMVAVEACAHSRPVIASDVGGLPEIVIDGLNGILCDPTQKESLGDALQRLVENRDELVQMSRDARTSIEAINSAERLADEYESVYLSEYGKMRKANFENFL
ncbi:glycosyltransferase family 4 protein [Paraburkholderia metrosideri]|uniref:Glycosyltransferase family 4 protein n=1 Tax=Paraburkholderia metrosideri TaxID=580937 RepID=A0ABW9E1E5_9BURK